MLESGYSKATSLTPKNALATKGFQGFLEAKLSDHRLADKHSDLLDSVKLDQFVFPNSLDDKDIARVIEKVPGCKLVKIQRNSQWARAYFSVPDNRVQLDTLKEAYKVRDKYPRSTKEAQTPAEIEEAILYIRRILPAPAK